MTKDEVLALIDKAEAEGRPLTQEEQALIDQFLSAEPKKEEETPQEETKAEPEKEEEVPEEGKEEEPQKEEESPKEEEKEPEAEEEPKEEKEEEKRTKKLINKKMEKRFNLMQELRKAMETGKKIQLGETRAYTVNDEGEDVVQTDIYDIWMPLRAKNVLTEAGAKVISGIKNNVQIPVMGKVNCGFAGEVAAAEDGSAGFTSKKLVPHRICAKYPISLELLAQDSIGIENAIRTDISNALYSKLEEVLLSDAAGTDDKPAGIFYGVTPTTVSTFADVANLEATLESNNVEGNIKYVVSPQAKASLRALTYGGKSTRMVMENGEVDGTPAYSTSNVADKKFVVADWSNLVIATWDNVSIDVVRDSNTLTNGQVMIVVNAFVDGKIVRPEGFAFGTF